MPRRKNAPKMVLQAMQRNPIGFTVKTVMQTTGLGRASVEGGLRKLVAEGRVHKEGLRPVLYSLLPEQIPTRTTAPEQEEERQETPEITPITRKTYEEFLRLAGMTVEQAVDFLDDPEVYGIIIQKVLRKGMSGVATHRRS